MKDDSKERWTKLKVALDELNGSAKPGVKYKLIFAGRHGQGYRVFASCYCLRFVLTSL